MQTFPNDPGNEQTKNGTVVSMKELQTQGLAERTGFSEAVESGFGTDDDVWRKE